MPNGSRSPCTISAGQASASRCAVRSLLGRLRRMERIAEADQPGDTALLEQIVRDQARHAAAHRLAADHHRPAARQLARPWRDTRPSAVRPSAAACASRPRGAPPCRRTRSARRRCRVRQQVGDGVEERALHAPPAPCAHRKRTRGILWPGNQELRHGSGISHAQTRPPSPSRGGGPGRASFYVRDLMLRRPTPPRRPGAAAAPRPHRPRRAAARRASGPWSRWARAP